MMINKSDENLHWTRDMLCLGRLVANKITKPDLREKAFEMCSSPPEMTLVEGLKKTVELQKWWEHHKVDEFVDWGLPSKFEFSSLKSRYRSDNKLSLYKISETKELHSEIPPEIFQLFHLRSLSYFGVNFSNAEMLSNLCEKLPNLKELTLIWSSIQQIPHNIQKLSSLKTLDLAKNLINFLPSTFAELTNLEILNLERNKLKKIPQEIFHLTNLKNLKLISNKIKYISYQINNLKKLESLDISDNQIKEITLLSELQLKELGVRDNPIRWDLTFLEYARKNALDIRGFECEKCPRWNRIEFSLSETFGFDHLLKAIKRCVHRIKQNENVRIQPIEGMLMHLSNHLNSENSILSHRYEEINQLKKADFHLLVEYILASLNSKLIYITLNTLVPLLELDNKFLNQIPIERFYFLFSNFFKNEKDISVTDIGLRCLIYADNYEVDDCKKKSPHSLSFLKMVSSESLVWVLQMLRSRQIQSKGKDNFTDLKEFFPAIQSYFMSTALSSPSIYIYKCLKEMNIKNLDLSKLIVYQKIKTCPLRSFTLLIEGQEELKSLENVEKKINMYVKELNSNDCMASKIWEKLINNILIASLDSTSTYGEETFNFMYRRCYTNTLFIANSDSSLASTVLKNFCAALVIPSKTKKSLEAIALIKQANPNLAILNGWLDEKWAREFQPVFLSKIPQAGEKLAWCGAMLITEGLIPVNFEFTIPFDQILASNDPLLVPFINKIIEITQDSKEIHDKLKLIKSLQSQLEEVENESTHQFNTEFSNLKKTKLKFENIFNTYQNEVITSIESECEKIKFLFKDIPNINLTFLPSSNDKINALISINENVKSFRSDMNKLFTKTLEQLDALHSSRSRHSQKTHEMEFSKIRSLIELQCNSIFECFVFHLDALKVEIKNEFQLQTIEYYNKNHVRPIKESNDQLISKINQCKAIFDIYTSQIQHAIPEVTFENFNQLLEKKEPLDPHEFNIHSTMYKKMQKDLSVFTDKNFQIEESAKNKYLKEKNKKLKEKNNFLILQTKTLEEKLKNSEKLTTKKKNVEFEKDDSQVAELIQKKIRTLKLFKTLPPRDYWTPDQKSSWLALIKNLNELEALTLPTPKQFRNWERKEAWRLLELVGFQAKGELDGSHLEICHPLFNIHESVSFNTQKQTAIKLMKNYFESVHDVLKLWHREIMKEDEIPFGQ